MKKKTRNNIRIIFYLISLLILVPVFHSCKTTENKSASAMKSRSKNELLDVLIRNTIQYNTLSCNLKANIKFGKNNKSFSSNANLKLVRDEKLQLSFQPSVLGFGIEVFRLIVTPDSVLLLDRMNKLYVSESIRDIKEVAAFDFDFYNLQALFTNQLFIAGRPVVTSGDYSRFSVEQSKYEAMIRAVDNQQIGYSFIADYTDRIKSTEISSKSGSTSLSWQYDNYAPASDTQLFPMQMNMNLVSPKDEISMSYSFSKIDVNKTVEIDPTIPGKYSKISLQKAIEIIKNMME